MGVEENKAALARAFEAFSAGDREGWFAAHDPSVIVGGITPEPLDFEGMKQFYAALWSAFPDAHATMEDLIGEGDKVAFRTTFRGTHKGEFMGVPATGKSVAASAQGIYTLRNGKIVERWSYVDSSGLMQQLGAFPADASQPATD